MQAKNLVNELLNEYFDSLKKRTRLIEVNAELVKKNEEVEWEKVRLVSKLQELKEANSMLKKDTENNYQKRKICKDESEKL